MRKNLCFRDAVFSAFGKYRQKTAIPFDPAGLGELFSLSPRAGSHEPMEQMGGRKGESGPVHCTEPATCPHSMWPVLSVC